MSKRKGVSAEEKRTRMLQLFYEKKEFFQLKELEKIAPKEKGIIAQSVKEVIQCLVDDGLVDTDKIGTSVYYWAYPSKAKHQKKRKLDELSDKVEESRKRQKKTEEMLVCSKIGRENTDERQALLVAITDLQLEHDSLLKELQKYKDNDPEILKQLQNQSTLAKEAANRWTDNMFAIKSWCKNKFNINESALDKQFEIPAELDYLE
ncbi:hypothetical protein CBL_09707 [Carabus blaptoides fortunei]